MGAIPKMTDIGSCLWLQEAFANLTSKLNDSSLFNGYVSFNGMNSLATSVRHSLSPSALACAIDSVCFVSVRPKVLPG